MKNFTKITDLEVSWYGLANCEELNNILAENLQSSLVHFKCLSSVNDQTIAAIIQKCSLLRSIALTGTYNENDLTDATATLIGTHLKRLECIEISRTRLTDEGISRLAQGCPNLRKVNLHRANLITDASITILRTHCKQLQKLDLYKCRLISQEALETLVALKL
jgi:F-box and leucine-rich repeat protein 1 (S-phase kinase-associated protein 2)